MIKPATTGALVLLALLSMTVESTAPQGREEVVEEFHQTYPMSPDGRIGLQNTTGTVRIVTWDRNEVKVDAVKRAFIRERLPEVQIGIEAGPDSLRINTKYPTSTTNWNFTNNVPDYNNPASVDYTLTVPRNVRIDTVELVNGTLDLESLSGYVEASSVNARVRAQGLEGDVTLSSVNGQVEAVFNQLGNSRSITLTSVNGTVTAELPSDASADLQATTMRGHISNDFGLTPNREGYVGTNVSGTIGQGGARLRLNNTNGDISIRRR